MKKNLEGRIFLFAFIIIFLTVFANTGMNIIVFRKNSLQELLLRTQSVGNSLKTSIEKVLALGIDIRDVTGLEEKCKEAADDPDISYCIVVGLDGKPLFSNEAKYSTINFQAGAPETQDNKRFVTSLLNTSLGQFYNIVMPVRAFDARTVAYINVGFPKSIINQKIMPILVRSLAVLVLFIILSFALVVFFVRRSIISPITVLLEGVKKISQGNLSTTIPELPVYDFNELGAKITLMSRALESRDIELRKNYDELATTHRQLRDSFVQLESLSSELERSEELYKKLLEDAGDAIIILDRSLNVMIFNRKAEEFLGIESGKCIGQHFSSLMLTLKSDSMQSILKLFKDSFSGEAVSAEFSFSNPVSGLHQVGMIHGGVVTLAENSLLQIIIRDITREREIIKNLEASASGLSRLNQMKDSFLGLASHELKTPLTVIMGYSELLLSDMKDELPDGAADMVQHISAAGARLEAIVKDMIDVSMIDQRQLELKLVNVDINTLAETAAREMKYFLSLRSQHISLELQNGIPVIRGDQTRLMQMLLNIVGNAVKFTPDNGTLTIRTELLKKQEIRDRHAIPGELAPVSRYIRISVSDTGIGIEKADHEKIFEKFYEAGNIHEHSTGKVAFMARGTGLGLSITKGIVEMHGGRIWVESPGYDPDNCPGSTFFILLPVYDEGSGSHAAQSFSWNSVDDDYCQELQE